MKQKTSGICCPEDPQEEDDAEDDGDDTEDKTESEDGACTQKWNDCQHTKCCTDAGLTCYEQTQDWAQCLPTGTCIPHTDGRGTCEVHSNDEKGDHGKYTVKSGDKCWDIAKDICSKGDDWAKVICNDAMCGPALQPGTVLKYDCSGTEAHCFDL